MWIELSPAWLVAANVLAWLVIHMGVAWLGTQVPHSAFRPDAWLYRPRRWELDGRVYERVFRIRAWKDALPDGSALFRGGFRKKRLAGRDAAYLDRFERETCRGELVHEAVLLSSFLFFLWNPPWVGVLMIAYGVAANAPCILAQRYNRVRLQRLCGGDGGGQAIRLRACRRRW